MISPPVRMHAPPHPTHGLLRIMLAWCAVICCGAAASAALAVGSATPAWLLLLLAGLGAAAGVSAAAAALDRGWYATSACLVGVALATSLPALLTGNCVGRGNGFAFALPSWLGMGTATLFLSRPDAWADGHEFLAELPLLLLLHLPMASSAAASWLPAAPPCTERAWLLSGATAWPLPRCHSLATPALPQTGHPRLPGLARRASG